MTEIDRVLAFAQDFVRREHEAETAFFHERDEEKLHALLAAFNREFFEPPMHGRAIRPPVDEAFFARAASTMAERQPRLLFRVDHWKKTPQGEIFAAYASSDRNGDTSLASRFFIHASGGGFRIFSQYDVCLDCDGTGEVEGRACPRCRSTGWEHNDGPQVGPLEEPDDTRVLKEWEPL